MNLMSRLARLWRADRGVAAVELALVMPVMLLVYLGTLEASSLITMDRKIQSVAAAIGDLVARADEKVGATQMQDYFRAASGIMTPYSPVDVLQVVTAVKVVNGVPEVVWTRQYLNGNYSETTPHTVGDEYPLPPEMVAVSGDRMVIAAETSYTYTPLLGIVIDFPINLYRSSFFLPRFGKDITPTS